MTMSPGWRFGWEEAAKVVVSVSSCVHTQDNLRMVVIVHIIVSYDGT